MKDKNREDCGCPESSDLPLVLRRLDFSYGEGGELSQVHATFYDPKTDEMIFQSFIPDILWVSFGQNFNPDA